MQHLYLYINLGSILVPLIFSFHTKLQFYKTWKKLFPAMMVSLALFISWDVLFTTHHVWGFNPKYLSGYYVLNLPIEEWLFFICIPYACFFTHHALVTFFPNSLLSLKTVHWISGALILISIITVILHPEKWYTLFNFGYASLLLSFVIWYKPQILQQFYWTFLVILIPFLGVNGLLTGNWISEEVVWYNKAHHLGVRIGTIPVEDSMYALTMLLTTLLVMSLDWKHSL